MTIGRITKRATRRFRQIDSLTHLVHNSRWVLPFPITMNNVELDQMPRILIKRTQDVIDVMHIIEVPALSDEWVTQDILEGDSVLVEPVRDSLGPDQLER